MWYLNSRLLRGKKKQIAVIVLVSCDGEVLSLPYLALPSLWYFILVVTDGCTRGHPDSCGARKELFWFTGVTVFSGVSSSDHKPSAPTVMQPCWLWSRHSASLSAWIFSPSHLEPLCSLHMWGFPTWWWIKPSPHRTMHPWSLSDVNCPTTFWRRLYSGLWESCDPLTLCAVFSGWVMSHCSPLSLMQRAMGRSLWPHSATSTLQSGCDLTPLTSRSHYFRKLLIYLFSRCWTSPPQKSIMAGRYSELLHPVMRRRRVWITDLGCVWNRFKHRGVCYLHNVNAVIISVRRFSLRPAGRWL